MTRFVGLLMNVLSFKLKDDVPNRLAAFLRLIQRLRTGTASTTLRWMIECIIEIARAAQYINGAVGTDAARSYWQR